MESNTVYRYQIIQTSMAPLELSENKHNSLLELGDRIYNKPTSPCPFPRAIDKLDLTLP